ncbi:MAG: cryptochrome/photolyase family protein [Phormidesmis sp. RL_2_1]|nr:cryptochrome/photolyase family protein [Phormidesmis sp. RL_2_1]
MTVGIWILGDQLWQQQSALESCIENQATTPIILIESLAHVQERRYHRQKLILIWSAMRHFAEVLKVNGWHVTYETAASFENPLQKWIEHHSIDELRVMEPADRPFSEFLDQLNLPCKLVIMPNNHFLWSTSDFATWAASRKSLLMESFYREGRKRFEILMEDKQPVGGQWNFDKENRKPAKGKISPPLPLTFEPDEITQAVIDEVEAADYPTFGTSDSFAWAVTRAQALEVLADFVRDRLPTFGPYQDAMVTGEETLWHALLSPYLNLGLLQPMEVIEAVETAYQENPQLPLNSVEGLIRQVLGWREYMRGLYHHVDADYPSRNYFEHHQPLPDFFWDGNTPMNCLHQTLDTLKRTGYAHHIQRLMLLANFALIAGLSPQAVEDWFHSTFIDAYDWVMQTNVIGMGLFADGGMLSTKPYAASANYIHKMSDYCQGCQYDHKSRIGENACPFNFFYWDFLDRHREKLSAQGRMNFILKNLDKMSADERHAIRQQAQDWHREMA